MRHAVLALLLLSTTCLAQPNPFLVLEADSGCSLLSPRICLRDSTTADVFWIRRMSADSEQYVEHAVVSLASHLMVWGPDVIQHTEDWWQEISDVLSRGPGGWEALTCEFEGFPHQTELIPRRLFFQNGTEAAQAPLLVDSVTQYLFGCSGWSNSGARLTPREDSGPELSWIRHGCVDQGTFSEERNWIVLTGISPEFSLEDSVVCCSDDYFEGPEMVCCVSTHPDSLVTLSLNSIYNGQPEPYPPILRWQSLAGNVATQVLVRGPSAYWDLRRTRNGRLLALAAPGGGMGDDYPLVVELHRNGDATVRDTLARSYGKVAFHPDFGFALLYVDNALRILLERVDTTGTVVQPLGPFYMRDVEHVIGQADVTIGDDGRVAVLWTERAITSPETSIVKMAWVGWDTPLRVTDHSFSPQPTSFSLTAFPNPFNSDLEIHYDLPQAQKVELAVFNLLGQKVATLVDGATSAGAHRGLWSPACAGGLYFVSLKTAAATKTIKVLYLR